MFIVVPKLNPKPLNPKPSTLGLKGFIEFRVLASKGLIGPYRV